MPALKPSIIILEENPRLRKQISNDIGGDYYLHFWPDGSDLFVLLKERVADIVVMDLQVDGIDPFQGIDWIKKNLAQIPVLVMGDVGDAEVVAKAFKAGATDYIAQPIVSQKLRLAIERAIQNRDLLGEVQYLRHEMDVIYDFDRIVAESPIMKVTLEILKKFADTEGTILIRGETGTGKSFLSGTIHFNSHRRNKPFVKINCSNIPETLLESELFGHEKGVFTGADKLRIGRFEQANGGTLFLDEIGELSITLQGKLLRVLEEKCFERLGGDRTLHADVRVIAATNKNLEKQIREGKFREDLYYRINVLNVNLPPLRDRVECIESLSYWMLNKTCRSLRKTCTGISPEVLEQFKSYHWPGNIRQLANTIERAVILSESDWIADAGIALPDYDSDHLATANGLNGMSRVMADKRNILEALGKTDWVQKDAAKQLGISPRILNYRIKKYGIKHVNWRKNR